MTSATPYDGAEDTPTSASEDNRRRSAELFAVLNGDATPRPERHAAREELVVTARSVRLLRRVTP